MLGGEDGHRAMGLTPDRKGNEGIHVGVNEKDGGEEARRGMNREWEGAKRGEQRKDLNAQYMNRTEEEETCMAFFSVWSLD